jgi:hypothetical protein
MGRVARPVPGKDRAVVVDFVDLRMPMLLTAFRSRQRLYGTGSLRKNDREQKEDRLFLKKEEEGCKR